MPYCSSSGGEGMETAGRKFSESLSQGNMVELVHTAPSKEINLLPMLVRMKWANIDGNLDGSSLRH